MRRLRDRWCCETKNRMSGSEERVLLEREILNLSCDRERINHTILSLKESPHIIDSEVGLLMIRSRIDSLILLLLKKKIDLIPCPGCHDCKFFINISHLEEERQPKIERIANFETVRRPLGLSLSNQYFTMIQRTLEKRGFLKIWLTFNQDRIYICGVVDYLLQPSYAILDSENSLRNFYHLVNYCEDERILEILIPTKFRFSSVN